MRIILRNASDQPIYEQIYTQLKAQIISGTLSPGEALPSIRTLARDLKVSVITTRRAYDELEADGLLYTIGGKGCFVTEKDLNLLRRQQRQEMLTCLSSAVELGKTCGESVQSMTELLRQFWNETESAK